MTSLTYNEDLMRQAKRTIREADRSGKLSDSQRSALLTAGFPFERGIPCKDHLGQSFPSITAMCEAWGVDRSAYDARLKRGWTLEQALTGERCKVYDHIGRGYPTVSAMCREWSVSRGVYDERLKRGWSVEEALIGNRETTFFTDHLGREFASTRAMCEAWGVNVGTYVSRLKRGWSLEEALTGNREKKTGPKPCTDHLGQEFSSITAMCEAWGVDPNVYSARVKNGWSLEEALTGNHEYKTGPKPCTDHLGQEFHSITAMLGAWGISVSQYTVRLRNGWTLEEALTGNRNKKAGSKPCTDHTGQTFPNGKTMCEAWGVNYSTYTTRLNSGWTLEEALTGNRNKKAGPKPCTDHTGREFPSITAMCKAWGISNSTFEGRLKYGWSLEETLTHDREKKREPKPCTDHLGQTFPSITAMCEAWGVSSGAYVSRLKRGWTLEEALTGEREGTRINNRYYDHKGTEYPTRKAMCEAWGVNYSTYTARLNSGWTLEEVLTGIRKKGGNAK